MRTFVIFLTLFGVLNGQIWEFFEKQQARNKEPFTLCGYGEDVTLNYRKAHYNFSINTFLKLAREGSLHFTFSPHTVWQILAAVAEGTEGVAQQELFKLLNLPEDECIRRRYYEIASTRIVPGLDIRLERKSLLVLDENTKVNEKWKNFALEQLQLDTTQAPIKRKPKDAAYMIRQAISSQLQNINIQGNSVFLSSIDYKGLWTEAFSDAGVYRAPFYNTAGLQIGSVEMMRTRKRVRMSFIKPMNSKMIELSVGEGSRYRMMFAMPLGTDLIKAVTPMNGDLVVEALNGLKESAVPIDISIPKFVMESEWDVRHILNDIGVRNLWTDSLATRNISEPAAFPSSFIQRASITFDKYGMKQASADFTRPTIYSTRDTGLDPILGNNFIADRPFTLALIDADTMTVLMASAFSTPTFK